MPYKVRRVKNDARPFKVVKKSTGEVIGSSKTLADAKASIRAIYAHESKKGKT